MELGMIHLSFVRRYISVTVFFHVFLAKLNIYSMDLVLYLSKHYANVNLLEGELCSYVIRFSN